MLITLVGPTAVGKTRLSLRLAQQGNGAIVVGDPRQMYRGLDIGTAKPTPAEQAAAPHYLIDSLSPDEAITAGQWVAWVEALLPKLLAQYRCVVVVGGATLYMDALWYELDDMPSVPPEVRQALNLQAETEGLAPLLAELARVDPETYAHIDRQNPARVIRAMEVYRASGRPISHFRQGRPARAWPCPVRKVGLYDERDALYRRIDQRVQAMVDQGLPQEVETLVHQGYGAELQAMQSIGYREWLGYLAGQYDRAEAIRLIQRNSRRYAKRQLSYWRRYADIRWFRPEAMGQAVEFCLAEL